jgi:hypothetical protein
MWQSNCCTVVPMAVLYPIHTSDHPDEGVFSNLGRLAQLELELGFTEARELLLGAVIAAVVALVAAVALITALVVLLAAALAPIVGARWEHLLIAGGAVFLGAGAAAAWAASRLRNLPWPRLTVASFEENWRWLGAQLKSRLILS